MLGALVLAADHDARGQVGDPDGGVGGVHVLAARAAGTVGVDAQVVFVDLDVDVVVEFGIDFDRAEAGVPPGVAVEGRDAHQTVDPRFPLAVAVGELARDVERHALDPCLVAGLVVDDLVLPVPPFDVAPEHAEQHGGPVAGLGAAGPRVDGQIHVLAVKLAREEAQYLVFVQLLLQSLGIAFGIGQKFGLLGGHVDGLPEFGDRFFQLKKGIEHVPAGGKFAHGGLSGLLVVPEIGSGHFGFELLEFLPQILDVQKLVQVAQTAGHVAVEMAQFFDGHHLFSTPSMSHMSSMMRWISPRQLPQAPPALQ